MRVQALNRGGHPGAQTRSESCAALRVCAMLRQRAAWAMVVAACLLSGAAAAHARAGQSANPSNGSQQNSKAQDQNAQAKASGQQPVPSPASGPIVLGEDPDSEDIGSAPVRPASSPAQQPPATPAPGTLARWNPANPPGESAAAQPAAMATASSGAPPVPTPANAGSDSSRQQINDQCVNLFEMANDLKAAVDKTNKDVLSVAVVRKADEIEALARQMKDEMKPKVGKK